MNRFALALTSAALLSTVAPGCAGLRAQRARGSALHALLESNRIPQPLPRVWPEALKLLAEKDFPLTGADRAAGGQSQQGTWGQLLSPGFETRSTGRGYQAETGWGEGKVRYRVDGFDTGGGTSRIAYTRIEGSEDGPNEVLSQDDELSLLLVSRVDPAGAQRIEEDIDKALGR